MTEAVFKKPVLSAKDMAEFMLKNPLEYRRRCLILFQEIHEPSYVEAVKRELIKQYKPKKQEKK